jgi:hypothetical protein
VNKEVAQARALLLEELIGMQEGQGSLFRVDYTVLIKIAQIVRLEGTYPLQQLLQEITKQRPDWRIEDETLPEARYHTPDQFAQRHPYQLDVPAWLIIQPKPVQGVVATLHLGDGSLYVLVIPNDPT